MQNFITLWQLLLGEKRPWRERRGKMYNGHFVVLAHTLRSDQFFFSLPFILFPSSSIKIFDKTCEDDFIDLLFSTWVLHRFVNVARHWQNNNIFTVINASFLEVSNMRFLISISTQVQQLLKVALKVVASNFIKWGFNWLHCYDFSIILTRTWMIQKEQNNPARWFSKPMMFSLTLRFWKVFTWMCVE